MNSPTSFFGKCVTVLIGMALSWATMTNPQIEQLARQFLGQTQSTSSAMLDEEQFIEPFVEPSFGPIDKPLSIPSTEDIPTHEVPLPSLQNFASQPIQTRSSASRPAPPQQAQGSTLSDEDRIHLASQTLREMGATYLRLERLTKPAGECYRVRCDLAGETEPVKCCYEATGDSAVAAMEDVLRAVREGVANDPTKVASSG